MKDHISLSDAILNLIRKAYGYIPPGCIVTIPPDKKMNFPARVAIGGTPIGESGW